MGDRTSDVRELASQTEANLTIRQSPFEFQAVVEEARDRVGPYLIFRKPDWRFWREAWAIGRFAQLIRADGVQLTAESERYPDGRVWVGSEVLDVEVTEAMMPDRRRANEYAPDAPSLRLDPVDDWNKRLDELPNALDKAIRKKVDRLYGTKSVLLVYLNIGTYGDYRKAETRSKIMTIKEEHASGFAALYVLWDGELL